MSFAILSAGVLLWTAAHWFKRLMPAQREALGLKAKGAVALLIFASLGLMIWGYRGAEIIPVFDPPNWGYHANNTLMLIALFLVDIGRVNSVTRTKLRHPMLIAAVIWVVAHLLVNGDLASLILFGGLGLWALGSMVLINRGDGPWVPPAPGKVLWDGVMLVAAIAVYAGIVWVHDWLGYQAFFLF